MDPRLRPLNAVLALVRADESWCHALADQGFRLHAIESKVQSSLGVAVADAVIYREDPDLVLVCEGKSGRNVEDEQAKKYAAADPNLMRRAGSLPDVVSTDAVVCPLYVVMNDVRADVEAALQAIGVPAPVLSIDRGFARLDGPCPDGLEPFLWEEKVGPRRWPFGRVRVDHQSPLEELAELLAPQIVAAMANRERVLDLEEAARKIYRQWPVLSRSGRREFVKRLRMTAQHLAKEGMKDWIRLEAGSNDIPPRVLIDRTPADFDIRGMPQGWQGLARHLADRLGRGGGPPPEEDAQLSLDDLDLGDTEEADA